MVGQGIGASLLHEVGHQASDLLGLLNSVQASVRERRAATHDPALRAAWFCWEKWSSEAISDFWAIAHLGPSATLGLIGVVSLPRALVFRIDLDDPHPFPWIRVMLSAAIGDVLYPHPQWAQISGMWESMYPTTAVAPEGSFLIEGLRRTMREFASVIAGVRPKLLRGEALGSCLRRLDRSPNRLWNVWECMRSSTAALRLPPTLALAAVSQARADGRLSPESESRVIRSLLTEWAIRSSLDSTNRRAFVPPHALRVETHLSLQAAV
jgi:hypothetical protein